MPKSAKRKKERAADFSKAKLKLGKGKQTPSNAVDTSFKARSIALPSQTIAHEKSQATPTTKRRLSLDDLVSHLKHYNVGVRKDALLGFRELFEDYPDVVVPSLSTTLTNCARVIGDEDSGVRKGLLAFLSWLLPRVPQDLLIPHTPILILFTTSAQTHIFPEIRIDAVRFLNLFLEIFPSVVVEGWSQGRNDHGRRVLEGYLGILNAGTAYGEEGDTGPVKATSTASVVLSAASKLVVLKSLATFLTHALSSRDTGAVTHDSDVTPTWFMSSSFTTPTAFAAFDSLIRPIHSIPSINPVKDWVEEDHGDEAFVHNYDFLHDGVEEGWSLNELMQLDQLDLSTETGSSTGAKRDSAFVTHLSKTLHPILISTFLDNVPAVFSPGSSPSETETSLVLAVARLARCLYRKVASDSAELDKVSTRSDLETLLNHMFPYFPFSMFTSHTARRDIKTEQVLEELNLIFCELTSVFLLFSDRTTPTKAETPKTLRRIPKGRTGPKSPSGTLEIVVDRVSDYVIGLLQGKPDAQSVGIRSMTPSAYSSLLPTIWALISDESKEKAQEVIDAVVEHSLKASSTSAVKRHTLDFLGCLVLLETAVEYQGSLRIIGAKIKDWLLHLPRVVWELGSSHLSTTETIFRLVLRMVQRRSQLLDQETMSQLGSRFAVYFKITHPTRGELPGPYAKLPVDSPLRALALDVAACIAALDPGSSEGLVHAVEAAVGGREAAYWTSIRA